jgi:hypothetical protein
MTQPVKRRLNSSGFGTVDVEIMRGSGEMWFRLPRPLKRQIVEVASRFEETQSAVVVRALEYYFEHQLGIVSIKEKATLP